MNFYNNFIKLWQQKFPNDLEPITLNCLKADDYLSIRDQKIAIENVFHSVSQEVMDIKTQLDKTTYIADYLKSALSKLSAVAQIFDDISDNTVAHSTAEEKDISLSNSFLSESLNRSTSTIFNDDPRLNVSVSEIGIPKRENELPTIKDVQSSAMKIPELILPNSSTKESEGEFEYKCLHCSRSYSQKSGLELHEKVHTGERPFECDICGRAFKLKSQLQIHERVHSGERPFGCRLCGKLFRQQCHVVQHLRCHTGEKPHQCTKCGKKFRQKHSLLAHERRLCQTTRRPRRTKFTSGTTIWIGLNGTESDEPSFDSTMSDVKGTTPMAVALDDSSSISTIIGE